MTHLRTVRIIWILTACLTPGSEASACDLMGASFDREVQLDPLFEQFRRISEKRDFDGWGVAFYTDRSATVFKAPIPAAQSELAQCLIDKRLLKTKLVIAHLRAASVGKPSHRNTHPWTRELGGVEYAMAHVGGADRRLWSYVKLDRFKPNGENCAEHMFCHILGEIDRRGIDSWDTKAFEWLRQTITKLNEVQTTSLLLSDGTHLFAYSSTRTSWVSYVQREMPAANRAGDGRGSDKAVGIVVARDGHNLAKPGEQWTKIPGGCLAGFKDGRLIYQSQPGQ